MATICPPCRMTQRSCGRFFLELTSAPSFCAILRASSFVMTAISVLPFQDFPQDCKLSSRLHSEFTLVFFEVFKSIDNQALEILDGILLCFTHCADVGVK